MTNTLPSYPRLHAEQTAGPASNGLEESFGLDGLCGTFQQATGWQLTIAPERPRRHAAWSTTIDSGPSDAETHLSLQPTSEDATASLAQNDVQPLAEAIGQLLGQLQRTRLALWQREAELAAGVPLVTHSDEHNHLAQRLEAVLRGGAEAVGCQAAALYLLDDATSQLKLRSAWKLPAERLLEPPRPLRGAVADLEALAGHAVVLEDTRQLPHWNVPEQFASAVCVPVSTPTVPLGTMWMFGRDVREFSSEQTNLVEIVAGRIAADLEREMLLQHGVATKQVESQLSEAVRMRRNQMPQQPPLIDDWEVAGWTAQNERLGGDFYHWHLLPDGKLAIAVGQALGDDLPAALTASAVQAVVLSHVGVQHTPGKLIEQVNRMLWTGSSGDQFAGMFYGILDPTTGRMRFSTAGQVGAFVLRPFGWDPIAEVTPPLGVAENTDCQQRRQVVAAGDALVVLTDRVEKDWPQGELHLGRAALAEMLLRRTHLSAEQMVEKVQQQLQQDDDWSGQSVVVVKRRS